MLNFLGFMFFSSLEFFTLMMIILSVFSIDVRYYKKEILLTTITMTLLSYLLTALNLYKVFPLPLIEIPALILLLRYSFQQKWRRSIIAVIGGFFFFGVIEYAISTLAVYMNYVTFSDMQEAFTLKGYVMESVFSVIGTSIAIYIKTFNGGFGFTFRKDKYKTFIYTSIGSMLLVLLNSYALIATESLSIFITLLITMIFASIIVFYFSYKRDVYEFSD